MWSKGSLFGLYTGAGLWQGTAVTIAKVNLWNSATLESSH